MATVGERIKEARIRKGYSQTELAKLLGYKSRSSINKIETEERDIPRNIIVEFSKILDVSPCYLMGWDDEPKRTENKLSEHEKVVITAYRSQPEMQSAVDRLLGIVDDSSIVEHKIAAYGGDNVVQNADKPKMT